ncbi:BnaCnng54180D [Brassica napus]|uniref:BnaCnng20270D protein n=1 Tax=Brassica napus TaxID=3708 RepID=A0A078JLJ0_BRANA|nr:BnaCnng20270D [Brassica napus]CDY67265.1 BnaCnng54180D [Brassica napus]
MAKNENKRRARDGRNLSQPEKLQDLQIAISKQHYHESFMVLGCAAAPTDPPRRERPL